MWLQAEWVTWVHRSPVSSGQGIPSPQAERPGSCVVLDGVGCGPMRWQGRVGKAALLCAYRVSFSWAALVTPKSRHPPVEPAASSPQRAGTVCSAAPLCSSPLLASSLPLIALALGSALRAGDTVSMKDAVQIPGQRQCPISAPAAGAGEAGFLSPPDLSVLGAVRAASDGSLRLWCNAGAGRAAAPTAQHQ